MENNKPTTEEKKYYLGLDIGTNSIGWAVTDENYHLIRKQGKHLWGSRLFDEAQTAKTRRQQREARRRLERRRQRILLLQGIFKPEMDKVDPYFFDRLNNSALHREDKPNELSKSKYLLFTGEGKDGLTDKTYYEKYPTIYHLRLDLIEHPEKKFDLREIYLALAHMVKYRGNFLYDSEMSEESIGSAQNLKEDFDLLDEKIRNSLSPSEEDADSELPEEIPTFHLTFEEAQKIFLRFQEESRLSLLQESLKVIRPEAFKDPLLGNLLKVITGSKVSLLKLFPEWKEKLEDEENAPSIDFSDEDKWEELLASFPLEDEQKDILLQAKKIYDDRILIHFLKGEKSLSKAMVNRYELHHEQLVQLKKLWKEKIANAPTEEKKNEWKKHYDEFFRALTDEGKGAYASYSNYIGYTSVDGEKETQSANSLNRTTTREDLYKKLKEKDFLPDGLLDAPSIEGSDVTIQTAIDKETYLLRQNARENGAFPYQLNLREMKIILENQKQYYPFLGEKAKDFANPEKESFRICSLLEYRVPYYVGPLSNRQEEKAIRWAVRKPGQEGVRITPWNFNDVIDEKKSALGFLDRLKGKCSYLIGEPTLPSASPIFQEYKVYNEMNGWLLNGEPLKMEDKDYLMENLYRKHRGVSLKNIENTLRKKYNQDVELTSRGNGKPLNGEDIHANCSTYFDLKKYLGEDYDRDPKKADLAEEIAEDLTAFEDKKMRRESLIEAGLNPTAANELSNIHYSGWGALSKKFLTGIKTEYHNPSTGEVMEYSVLDLLHETNDTMMEIYYNSKYTFQEQIEKANESRQPTLDDILEAHNTSPIMKRALIQCVNHLIPELKKSFIFRNSLPISSSSLARKERRNEPPHGKSSSMMSIKQQRKP